MNGCFRVTGLQKRIEREGGGKEEKRRNEKWEKRVVRIVQAVLAVGIGGDERREREG